jgi:hypothetical protein
MTNTNRTERKRIMTDKNYTALLFIVDRSGSMQGIRDDMVGGLTTLLEDQKGLPGFFTIDMVQFNDTVDTVHQMASPENVAITLEPGGGTALYDAIGIGVNGFIQRIAALPEHAKPQAIQVVVVTDGAENSSTEYTAQQVKALITDKQSDDCWDFIFLGANQDAVVAGGELGFREDASMTFVARGDKVHEMNQATSRYIRDRRSGTREGFSTDERGRSAGGEH